MNVQLVEIVLQIIDNILVLQLNVQGIINIRKIAVKRDIIVKMEQHMHVRVDLRVVHELHLSILVIEL